LRDSLSPLIYWPTADPSTLSLTAAGRLAERIVRKTGEPMPVTEVIRILETYDVDIERARAGVALATVVGRLEGTTDSEGRQCVQIPAEKAA
jgi:hypothetical protein